LADVTRLLAERQINIRALCVAETVDYGVLRLVVSDPDRARAVLAEGGFTVTETEVLAVEVADQPGGLAQVVEPLSKADINVEYLYAFVGRSGGKALVVFRVEDLDRAITLLQQQGVRMLKAEEVYSL
jgi:hypothetical protein